METVAIDARFFDEEVQKELWYELGGIAWGRDCTGDFEKEAAEDYILIPKGALNEPGFYDRIGYKQPRIY